MVIVGVDGSRASRAALAWALEDAELRGVTLAVVTAWIAPDPRRIDAPPALQPELEEALQSVGERVIDHALDKVLAGREAGVAIERLVVPEAPARALLDASADAELLVVGSRGHGGFLGLLLGSVSQQCAHHARCAVAIVRHQPTPQTGAILVGVDGSDESKRALRFADEEARLRAASLVALHAHAPAIIGPGPLPVALPVEASTAELEGWLDAVVVEVLGEERARQVERRVVETSAAAALIDAAAPRDLVVVGSRGHGGFAGLLLGSVSQQVAYHAPCPVVIVRGLERGGEG